MEVFLVTLMICLLCFDGSLGVIVVVCHAVF